MRYTLASFALLLSTTLAHGGVRVYTINDKAYEGCDLHHTFPSPSSSNLLSSYDWASPLSGQRDLIQRSWHQNPLSDPTSLNITCNYHGAPVTGAYHAPITAGDTISTTWAHDGFGWVHTVGPIMAYMASCPNSDCTTANTARLEWFKIAEEGLRSGFLVGEAEGWFQNDLWENRVTDHWNVTVPRGLKAGKYMVRHEIVNLELDPVQFYPNCAQFEVVGDGEESPGEEYLVKFPGGYSLSGECSRGRKCWVCGKMPC
jgi:hypothetical protein